MLLLFRRRDEVFSNIRMLVADTTGVKFVRFEKRLRGVRLFKLLMDFFGLGVPIY